ncbi:MAG: HEAT repeat domain-containing protein [Planctomycetota bacterium]
MFEDQQKQEANAQDLLEQLSKEFEALAKKSKHRIELNKAAELLESTNQNSRWTNYKRAIELLRQTRDKAGIPLMMKYMIRHASFGSSKANEYVEAISIITGHQFGEVDDQGSGKEQRVLQWVEDKYNNWWKLNKAELETRLSKMEPEQLEVVLDVVLGKINWQQGYERDLREDVTAYRLYHMLFYKVLKRSRSSSDRQAWYDVELDKAMVPLLLAEADYQPKGIPEGDSPTVKRVPYAVVDLLSAMRKDNLAPQLDDIAEDPKQNPVTRLTCIFAMYAAGERMDTNALMSILKTENRLEPRLNTILALQHSDDPKGIGEALIKLLDDRNLEVRSAAVYALRGPKPAKAVEKLALMLKEPDSSSAFMSILGVLGEIGTDKAKQAIADFMQASLDGEADRKHLYYALRAFEEATGQRWNKAGAQDEAFYREKAKEALDWWDSPRD